MSSSKPDHVNPSQNCVKPKTPMSTPSQNSGIPKWSLSTSPKIQASPRGGWRPRRVASGRSKKISSIKRVKKNFCALRAPKKRSKKIRRAPRAEKHTLPDPHVNPPQKLWQAQKPLVNPPPKKLWHRSKTAPLGGKQFSRSLMKSHYK